MMAATATQKATRPHRTNQGNGTRSSALPRPEITVYLRRLTQQGGTRQSRSNQRESDRSEDGETAAAKIAGSNLEVSGRGAQNPLDRKCGVREVGQGLYRPEASPSKHADFESR